MCTRHARFSRVATQLGLSFLFEFYMNGLYKSFAMVHLKTLALAHYSGTLLYEQLRQPIVCAGVTCSTSDKLMGSDGKVGVEITLALGSLFLSDDFPSL